jgi:hypothetical protein
VLLRALQLLSSQVEPSCFRTLFALRRADEAAQYTYCQESKRSENRPASLAGPGWTRGLNPRTRKNAADLHQARDARYLGRLCLPKSHHCRGFAQ